MEPSSGFSNASSFGTRRTVEEILTLANKLGGVSFATLLLIILYGSWRHVWVWERDVAKLEKQLNAEKQVLIEERDWWRNLAIRATGLAEVQGQLLQVREAKVSREVSDLNRQLE